MVILGIDPGFGITGYGLIEVHPKQIQFPKLIEAGILSSKKESAFADRLSEIHKGLVELIEEFSPESLALEEVYSSGAFPKSAIQIGQVQGIVLLAASQAKIPVHMYYPIQVKKCLIGFGRGTKMQMQKMIQRTLGLSEVPRPDDVADALAVAICHANRVRGILN